MHPLNQPTIPLLFADIKSMASVIKGGSKEIMSKVTVPKSVTFSGVAQLERNLQKLSTPSRRQRKKKLETCGTS
jgi:hypothetical protein